MKSKSNFNCVVCCVFTIFLTFSNALIASNADAYSDSFNATSVVYANSYNPAMSPSLQYTRPTANMRSARRNGLSNSCTTSDGASGTCMSRFQCMRRGGTAKGSCTSYVGVCCEIEATTAAAEGAKSEDESDNEEYEEMENNRMVEKTFKFEDFAKRLLNPKIVRACTVVLSEWQRIPAKSLKAAVTILHRIAYGCSCPAMLYQAKLFLIFQQVFNAARDAHHEELRRLGVYVMRKFVEVAPNNPKIYAELLFYKTIKEANELETGYCDAYETGTKAAWSEEQENELRLLFEENQRNPATDKDVIDWILENLIDKKRTRRGVLRKLKELGLMFKAPTKKSSSAAASAKNLWQYEEDEELRSLYDMHRLEPDCLQRIMQAFFDRRSKQQIIKRMIQIHIIADKSEILTKKPRVFKKKQFDTMSGNESVEEFMEEPCFGEEDSNQSVDQNVARANKPRKTTKPMRPKKQAQRKIMRTVLDVGTIRAFLGQIDSEKFQAAVDWLKECLEDAADEEEAPAEEDDGVPLLPLTSVQKEAMDNAEFKKLLIALGIQPPILGIENYWRIPIYLNKADLKIRARILAGEEIEIDMEGLGGEDDKEEEAESEVDTDYATDNDDEINKEANKKKRSTNVKSDSEEDALDVFARQRKHLNALLYTKSDEETEARAPLIKEKQKKKEKRKQRKKQETNGEDDDDDDEAEVNDIKRKLDKKKRKPDLSTDDESGDDKELKQKTNKKARPEPPANAEALFEQLKNQRAKKKQTIAEVGVGDADVDDLLNFNSEDYRKRLLELGDSDEDEQMEMESIRVDEDTDSDGDGDGADDEDKENANKSYKATSRTRRINIIDSESDEEGAGTALIAGKSNKNADADADADNNDDLMGKRKSVKDDASTIESASNEDDDGDGGNEDADSNDNEGVDKTGNQFERRVEQPSSRHKKGRQTSTNMAVIDADNKNADVVEGSAEAGATSGGLGTAAVFIKRKKSMAQHDDNDDDDDNDAGDKLDQRRTSPKETVKRRRIAIIDDDEDDDDA